MPTVPGFDLLRRWDSGTEPLAPEKTALKASFARPPIDEHATQAETEHGAEQSRGEHYAG
jgi:hypothetical protein